MEIIGEIGGFLPDVLRGTFVFYPMVILVTCFFVFILGGLYKGITSSIAGKKIEDSYNTSNIFYGILSVLQVVCLVSIVLSVFLHAHPQMKPGEIESQRGIGFAIVVSIVFFIIGPSLFNKVDHAFFVLGETPYFLLRLLKVRGFRPGCKVVQTVNKHSKAPGPRAREIRPEVHGDYIDYVVDKFRRVVSVGSDKVTIITRRGKLLTLNIGDPQIRRAGLIERVKYYHKFPSKETVMRQELSQ